MSNWRCAAAINGTICLSAALLSGCHAGDSAVDPSLHDSAGTRLIEYKRLPSALPRLAVEGQPTLELGVGAGNARAQFDSHQPFLVPVVLSDGRIAVNDRVAIKYFTSAGGFLTSAGRRGTLPGEFQQIGGLCRLAGDTLLAIDYSDGRLSVWDPTGRFVREYPRLGHLGSNPCLGDGTILVSRLSQRFRRSDTSEALVRARLDGTVITLLGDVATSQYRPIVREVSVIAAANRIYIAEGKTYEVRIEGLDGEQRQILRIEDEGIARGDAWFRIHRWFGHPDGRSSDLPPNRGQTTVGRAYGRLLVGPDGRMWIQGADKPNEWTVFDSSGKLVGRLVLGRHEGSGASLVAVDTNRIVLLRPGPDKSPRLTFFRLLQSRQ